MLLLFEKTRNIDDDYECRGPALNKDVLSRCNLRLVKTAVLPSRGVCSAVPIDAPLARRNLHFGKTTLERFSAIRIGHAKGQRENQGFRRSSLATSCVYVLLRAVSCGFPCDVNTVRNKEKELHLARKQRR